MEKPAELSVFFPAYNEEGAIASTVEKALNVLKSLDLKKYEVIIIDDGSKDNTGKIADQLASKNKIIRVIHQTNGGYGYALRNGFDSAKFEWIVYTDADGQFDFSEVVKFLEKAKEAQVIYGYKIKRSDNFFRVLAAYGWELSLLFLFGLKVSDVDTGFKMVHKDVLDKVTPFVSTRGGMINAELAIKAQKAGFKVARVAVHHYPRLTGKSTGVSLKVILNSYRDLFKLWLKMQ
ncbi:MAG: glycosyltransferase family 2 protein [bacterium]|nr:glycosyltransferase family 2 protein [bacterium]